MTTDTVDTTDTKTSDTSTKTDTKTTDVKADKASTTDDKKTTAETSDFDWRGAIAGEDKKLAKQLERFTDLPTFGKSFFEAQTMLRDGRRVVIPGAEASDEDRAAYAKARGIPDDPKKYEIKVKPPEGYEVSETDQARLEAITERLHKRGGIHADPDVVNAVHELYFQEQEEAQALAQATATRQRELTDAALNKLWPGQEKKRNIAFAQAAAERFFGKEWNELKDMQFVDGSLFGDNLQVLQAFAKVGRLTEEDPIFLEAGRNGVDAAKSLEAEKQKILSLMATNRAEYNKPENQKRLAEIYDAQARHEERGQSAN